MGTLKNVLYVGYFEPYMQKGIRPTVESRFDGLRRLGLNIVGFDSTPAEGEGLWRRRFNHRFHIGPAGRRRNRELVQAAKAQKPDVIWIDKGYWIYPRTLEQLKQHAQYLVHYNTDDIYARSSWAWLHRAGAHLYDLHLSTNRDNVQEIRQQYRRPSVRTGMGYDANVHTSRAANLLAERLPIVFIGHWEPHSEQFVQALNDAGCEVRVWGLQWKRAANPRFRSVAVLPGASYVSVLASAEIALCFLSKANRNESTGRSFEIPSIGTFMLAQRTDEHEFLYGDGVGAGLFSTPEELVDKARYYLSHSDVRNRVALNGHERCMRLGLSWQDHMRREWSMAEKVLTSGLNSLPEDADLPFWRGFRNGSLPVGSAQVSPSEADAIGTAVAEC